MTSTFVQHVVAVLLADSGGVWSPVDWGSFTIDDHVFAKMTTLTQIDETTFQGDEVLGRFADASQRSGVASWAYGGCTYRAPLSAIRATKESSDRPEN